MRTPQTGKSAPRGGSSDPYREIARFYELEHCAHGVHADALGYVRRGLPGPALVLGCGTGRICRSLEAVRRVTGLDASHAMLVVAGELGGTTRYVHGDMRHFELDGCFSEVIAPNASFAFLDTRRDQTSCLLSAHRALLPHGVLTLDLPMPDHRLLGVTHSPEQLAWQTEHDGRHIRRTRETQRAPVEGRIRLTDRFYVDDELVAQTTLALRLFTPRELEWMLESCGFAVEEFFGDHAGNPLREGCPRLLVRAVRL